VSGRLLEKDREGEGGVTVEGERGGRWESEMGGGDGLAETEDGDSDSRRYQTRIPDIPQGASTFALVIRSIKRAGIHGDGQRPPTAVVLGDWQDGNTMVRMQWVDTAKRSAFARVPMGGGWERTDIRHDMGG